jgi:hypothetical protein
MKSLEQYLFEFKTTLQYHKELNPLFWKNDKLKSEVRKKLVEIGKFWAEFSLIPKSAIKDILLTGGNANYNYTKFSDLDVHILINKKDIAECEAEIIDDFLRDKKALWSLKHDVKVYGFPVELYAQDIDEKTSPNQGVFSLLNNKWLKKPVFEKVNLQDPSFYKKVRSYMHQIDDLINDKTDNLQILEDMKEKIKKMRTAGVQKGGEFSLENLVFKELRNKGYLDKLAKYVVKVEDKKFSLELKGDKNDRRAD